jgi:hypothetical protein
MDINIRVAIMDARLGFDIILRIPIRRHLVI